MKEKIQALHLKKGDYVVVAGGVLAILGLRPTNDIDLVVSQEMFNKLKSLPDWQVDYFNDQEVLKNDPYDVGVSFDGANLETLLLDSLSRDGVEYMNPERLLNWKQKMNREKDQRDITLLLKYLSQHKTG